MAENKVIAVDLGGTNLRIAVVQARKISKYKKYSTPKTKKELLKIMAKGISEIMSKDVRGIGVGSPGPLKNGVILNSPNLAIHNFDLENFLQKKFKKKVVVENDANCVALAEAKYGVKKNNFFILTFGTGIGGGIIIDGKLYRGQGNAGELGHIIIDDKKDFESWWKKYRKKSLISKLVKSKKRRDKRILKNLVDHLGQAIASLINVLDPEVVVLMGGAREAGNKFTNLIQKKVNEYKIIKGKHEIVWSKLKYPGILGASLLVK